MMPAMAGRVVFNQINREPAAEFHRPVSRQNKAMPNFRDFLREFGIFAVMLRRQELERIKA